MNRRFVIMLTALIGFVGLYLYDRDNSTELVLRGQVLSLESQSADQGADKWLLNVEIDGQSLMLSPLHARPNVKVGDTMCVSRITRQGQPDEYRRTTGNASC